MEVSLNGAYNPQDRENLQQGGELRLALGELSEQQNPFQADGTAYTNTIWRYYNPQIGLFDGEGNFSANDAYISDVKDEEQGGKRKVTYTIRDEAQYNDGTPSTGRRASTPGSSTTAKTRNSMSAPPMVTSSSSRSPGVRTTSRPW